MQVRGNVPQPETPEVPATAEYNFFVDPGGADRIMGLLSPDSLRFETTGLRVIEGAPREGTLRVADDRCGQVNIAIGVTDGYQSLERAAAWSAGADASIR